SEEVDRDYLGFINDWRERLARDLLSRLGHNRWLARDDGATDLTALRGVVQRTLDRLVIARFAEDHLVVPPGTLRTFYEVRKSNPYSHSMQQFLDNFFRRFDEQHNSALFAPGLADQASFSDEALLPLIDKLYEARFRAMPADILGNTYEQYLGKTLAFDSSGSIVSRDNLETRKKQGSYYTPQVIVRYIVDNSLGRWLYGTRDGKPDGEPVEGEPRRTSADLADLRVLDSACGSGSFLIYAYEVLARFYESEIARLEAIIIAGTEALSQQNPEAPGYVETRIALVQAQTELARIRDHYPRLILESHLYGVDLDPQAAEIAVVNLMMRAMERRGREKRLPLILNQNVKVGNALVGMRPDDPRLTPHADALRQIADLRARLVRSPHGAEHDRVLSDLDAASAALRAALDEPFKAHFSDLERVRPFHWAAEFPEVFFLTPQLPLHFHGEGESARTPDGVGAVREPPADLTPLPLTTGELARTPTQAGRGETGPAHADLTPQLHESGEGERGVRSSGFTIIIGNPPWEIVKPDLREFYAQFDPKIESQYTRAQVEARIAALQAENPARQALYAAGVKVIEETAAYVRRTDDYTRQGRGDTATHKLFLERMYRLLRGGGRIGYLVPSGIYTDLGTKDLREMLLNEGSIQYVFSLSNERFFFPGVDHRFKFALVGAHKGGQSDGFWAAFRFNPRVAVAPDDLPAFLANPDNLIYMRRDSLARFSPESLSVMEFQTRRDYEIAEKIYDGHPLLGDERHDDWNIDFAYEFHMSNDRDLFNESGAGFPLYEGKMIHQFESQFAAPQYWINPDLHRQRIERKLGKVNLSYRVAFREVANATNERTCISAVLPPNSYAGHTLWVGSTTTAKHLLYYAAMVNSIPVDWLVRFKAGTHVTLFLMKSLPLPRLTAGHPTFDALVPLAARLTCTRPEYADLWREVMGSAWTEASGATDPAERQRLRDAIDARVARLYGLARDEFDHILGTFPLVFPESDAGRTRRAALLAAFDALG
ncbi:MAG: N-6 DNA methylase, partial [Anaerolineae bacterium]|nr:N-6 DNA methylase [Anaerolineae bacterium]